jgi:hypothetical protein
MGFEGRLKQGLYPLPAPRGYLDQGKGRPKLIDPIIGPLVRQAFDLYACGSQTFNTLREAMFANGLRGKTGKPLSLEGVSIMLRNSFYIGLIRIERTGQTFEGVHEPLIPKATFDRVQAIISGRVFARPQKHAHPYRRMIRCGACGYSLIAEVQKGHTYYRCHTNTCRGTSLRECDIDQLMRERLADFAFSDGEFGDIRDLAREVQAEQTHVRENRASAFRRDLAKCEDRLTRLTDAFLDGLIDKDTFETRKGSLIAERISLSGTSETSQEPESFGERVLKILERLNTVYPGYNFALPEEKRQIALELTSSLVARGKSLEITMRDDFRNFLEWHTRRSDIAQ